MGVGQNVAILFFLGRMNLYHTIKLRRILFLKNLEMSNNSVLCELFKFLRTLRTQSELHKVLTLRCNTVNLSCSAGVIRQIIFSEFADTVII